MDAKSFMVDAEYQLDEGAEVTIVWKAPPFTVCNNKGKTNWFKKQTNKQIRSLHEYWKLTPADPVGMSNRSVASNTCSFVGSV